MAELRVKSTGTLKLFESDNTSSVTIASPASLGGDRTVTLPDGDVTLVSGTAANTPYFFAYRGTSEQSIANGALTIIQFNAELYDSGSCFDTGTYKFTPNVAGKYWINATVRMGSSTDADNCQIEIFKNTTTFSRVNGSNRNYSSIESSAIIDMNGSSDYIQAKIYQDTGGAANIQYNSDSTYQTFLQGFFIGS
jgi:hypothetical protein